MGGAEVAERRGRKEIPGSRIDRSRGSWGEITGSPEEAGHLESLLSKRGTGRKERSQKAERNARLRVWS